MKLRWLILLPLGCFFLFFGIYLLVSAYHLNNPFWFIMTFFASSLIILISDVLIVGFFFRIAGSQKDPEE